MPVVIFKVSDEYQGMFGQLRYIAEGLPRIVSKALHTSGDARGHLNEKDIVVWGMDSHWLDINTPFIQVIVLCGDYESRIVNIEKRRKQIEKQIKKIWPEIKGEGFVWILPQQNESFGLL